MSELTEKFVQKIRPQDGDLYVLTLSREITRAQRESFLEDLEIVREDIRRRQCALVSFLVLEVPVASMEIKKRPWWKRLFGG